MLKKTITFKDLDGADVTEDFYFNLSMVELAELEIGESGIGERLQKIIETEDTGLIFAEFKNILGKAIGKRSEDGRRFIKNQDVVDGFFQSNAYETLFFEWITDPDAAAEFINGLMPSDLTEKVAAIAAQQKTGGDTIKAKGSTWITEGRVPTEAELVGATPDELREAFRRKSIEKEYS